MSDEQFVRLRGGGQTHRIPASNIYFPFGDGRLTYDCVSCNAECCRGHGYQLNRGLALERQLASAPLVRFFLDPCDVSEEHFHVKNCAPGCFFLTDGGRCAIQQQDGYSAKPETCRLFPFNDLIRIADYLLVAPHPSLCPLSVTTGDTRSQLSAYQGLRDELVAFGVDGHVSTATCRGEVSKAIEDDRKH